jgi:tRNA pseudouridine38-40 synthase
VTLKLTIGYDGTGFWGSQRQANARTVQEELERALEQLDGKPVHAELAGRTDRGVHAVGQVAHCEDIRPEMPEAAIRKALNRLLSDDVAVSSLDRVESGFHSRYDAAWREYRYRIWVGGKQPLLNRYAWLRRTDLDRDRMSQAASMLAGTHDLAAFTGGGEGVPWSKRATARRGTVRTILLCGVREVGPWWGTIPGPGYGLEIRIVADGFLPQLVRTITGALVAVGQGDRDPEWFNELLDVADRRAGPAVAPAHGLILWRVGYGSDVPDPDPENTQDASGYPPRVDNG